MLDGARAQPKDEGLVKIWKATYPGLVNQERLDALQATERVAPGGRRSSLASTSKKRMEFGRDVRTARLAVASWGFQRVERQEMTTHRPRGVKGVSDRFGQCGIHLGHPHWNDVGG
jgi:hypothetical protein